jgi:hypothetical protein
LFSAPAGIGRREENSELARNGRRAFSADDPDHPVDGQSHPGLLSAAAAWISPVHPLPGISPIPLRFWPASIDPAAAIISASKVDSEYVHFTSSRQLNDIDPVAASDL